MSRIRSTPVHKATLRALAAGALVSGALQAQHQGVVIQRLGAGSALEQAGLRRGDIVVAWQRPGDAAARGEIESVFDWLWLRVEQGPRGTVRLFGERTSFEVPLGKWDAEVRPVMPDAVLGRYLDGLDRIAAGEHEVAIASWLRLAADTTHLRGWLHVRIAEARSDAGDWKGAVEAYETALAETRDPKARVAIRTALGDCYRAWNRFDEARDCLRSALETAESAWGASLHVAAAKHRLSRLAWDLDQLDRADAYLREALELRQTLAEGSLEHAANLNSLGAVAFKRGELEKTRELYLRALEIRERLVPGGLEVSASLNNLGNVALQRGDLQEASRYQEAALAIGEKLAPEGLAQALALNNLGTVAALRGDLEVAEDHYRRALAIQEKRSPGGLDVALSLGNLGNVAQERGDLDAAADFHRRALEIHRRLSPDSLQLAGNLTNLGNVAVGRGDLDAAADFHRRALAINERLSPEGLEVAASFNNLGHLALEQDDLETAADFHRRASRIKQRLAPGSLDAAHSLDQSGQVALRRGQLEQAQRQFERSLEIRQRLAPDSTLVAYSRSRLGAVARERGEYGRAAEHFQRAIDALEAQIARLGGSPGARGSFRSGHGPIYRGALEALLLLDRPREAFAVLERSRARSFLELLVERDLVLETDVPEELERERRRLRVLYDRAQHRIAALASRAASEEAEELLKQLRELRRQYESNSAEIRRRSPRLAGLRHPQPLDFEAVRAALDPGTVMLSFSVGKDRTDLFVVRGDAPLSAVELDAGEVSLKEDVERLLDLIPAVGRPGAPLATLRRRSLDQLARRLYATLIRPAEPLLGSASRILIVPDGALHRLPWGALARDEQQYLIEWKPIHIALSGTVFAELRSWRRSTSPDGSRLAAFGDPQFPTLRREHAVDVADLRVRSVLHNGFDFEPLPATRLEVERIAALRSGATATTYLGAEATEERVKALGRDLRYLHLATHGLVDERFPLSSAVVLSIPAELEPERDNGLLQVWEIFESVRLDAELVVLSACASGLGAERVGEGLIGLTRAFQYAGARTVAASLWSVADRATAEMMVRFYRHLWAGLSKDEALRAAQIELIRSPIVVSGDNGGRLELDASAPYFWAAFQLYGDWR